MKRTILGVGLLLLWPALSCSGEEIEWPQVGEEVEIEAGDISLRASLLLPEGEGPFPAAVGLVGSGAYTYRGAWMDGQWAFWRELSQVLNAQNIALLMLEKRGVAGSPGNWKERTLQDRAEDALLAVNYLQGRSDIDAERIGVAGQSQGGWVAQIAAARALDDIAFVMTFAGPATTVLEQVVDDRESELRCKGEDEATIAKKREKYEERIRRSGGFGHLRVIRTYDPGEDLRAIRQPMIAIFAENDELVWAEKNVALLQQAFNDSGNPNLFVHVVEGANHAFLYGERCEGLKGHDGPPAFQEALLDEEFFETIGITLKPSEPGL